MSLTVSSDVVNRGRGTSFIFTITANADAEHLARGFNICDMATVWFRFKYAKASKVLSTSVQYKRNSPEPDSIVKLNISCDTLKYSKEYICQEDATTYLFLGNVQIPVNEPFKLKVFATTSKTARIIFADLYDDMVLTDFYLSSEEMKVAVHKVCLALHSNTFKEMLHNKWKETEEGCIEIKDFTFKTLQHLKQYMYLGKLPDALESVGPLLKFAKCYFMENLKEDCLMNLAKKLSSENLYEYLEYAVDNNLVELSFMVLEVASDGMVEAAQKLKSDNNISDAIDNKLESK